MNNSRKHANQSGFYFDATRCVDCHTCEVACSSATDVEPGIQKIKISQTWSGKFPNIKSSFLIRVCRHCTEPPCVAACPTGAISKRTSDGIVVVDRDICNGCRLCLDACQYQVPQFGSDGSMQKCDFCVEQGKEPVCAVHCMTGALKYCAM